MKLPTRLTHLGNNPSEHKGIINPPVYHASTITYDTVEDLKTRYAADEPGSVIYGRFGTPTTFALEQTVAELEQGEGAIAVSSGLAAISTAVLACLRPGDHVLVADTVYAPMRELCEGLLTNLNIEYDYYDPLIGARITELIKPNTRMLYMESPGSHTFEIMDVPAIMQAIQGHELITVFDNTYGSSVLFKPLQHGIDISLQAITKYIGGHADLMMGIVVCNSKTMPLVKTYRDLIGQCAAPDDVYLALRGIRTLEVRLRQHQRNAIHLAKWLESRDEVERVIHPALPSHPQHELWQRDFDGSNGLFSIILKPVSDRALRYMLEPMELFAMGFSWGGYESLIVPYSINTHRSASPLKYEGTLLRIHAGLEHIDDLIQDLKHGFERLNNVP